MIVRASAVAAIAARFDVTVAGAALSAVLMLSVIPAALRERGGGKSESDREKSKELSHTSTAWLTNVLCVTSELLWPCRSGAAVNR